MNTFPLDCVIKDGYSESADDGIRTYRAIDGTIKTHIMYTTTAYEFTAQYATEQKDYDRLMRFYINTSGSLFKINHPLTDVPLIGRFSGRPRLVQRFDDRLFVVQVSIAANPAEDEEE